MNDYKIIQIDEQTWRIENDGVRFFLLTGSEKALLIDCGMTTENAKEIAESLTDLPLSLLITHADRDHIGGIAAFDVFYMHPAEAAFYYGQKIREKQDYDPVYDGDVLDLGGRPLRIIYLPGHTPGSIGVLDVSRRALISGDPIQDGLIYMFGAHRELHTYIKSLKRLAERTGEFDEIWPSHATFPMPPAVIEPLIHAAEEILADRMPYTKAEAHGFTVRKYDAGIAVFLRDF